MEWSSAPATAWMASRRRRSRRREITGHLRIFRAHQSQRQLRPLVGHADVGQGITGLASSAHGDALSSSPGATTAQGLAWVAWSGTEMRWWRHVFYGREMVLRFTQRSPSPCPGIPRRPVRAGPILSRGGRTGRSGWRRGPTSQ
jgi:hypothetical protein